MAAKQFKNKLKTQGVRVTTQTVSPSNEIETQQAGEEDTLYDLSFYSGPSPEDCISIADVPFDMDPTFLDKIAGCYDGPVDLESIKRKDRSIAHSPIAVNRISSRFCVSRQRIDVLLQKAIQKLDFLTETGYIEPFVKLAEMLVEEFVNELDEAESVESFLKTYCRKHLKKDDLEQPISDIEIEILRGIKEHCIISFKETLEMCEYLIFLPTPEEEEKFTILRLVVGNQLSVRLKNLEIETGFSKPVGRPKENRA
jgi:hypothetical protein